jgi:hypothetical protein
MRDEFDRIAVVAFFALGGAISFVIYYVAILFTVTNIVIPKLPETNISYGQAIIINLPASFLIGVIVGGTSAFFLFVYTRLITILPSVVLVFCILQLYLETWRHFGFGKSPRVEYAELFPGVLVSLTGLFLLALVMLSTLLIRYHAAPRTSSMKPE